MHGAEVAWYNPRMPDAFTLVVRSLVLCASMLAQIGCAAPRATTPINAGLGVVAADHPYAESVGLRMLELGGNTVDAAVATSLALSVVRPDSCGLGGGGFMLIHLEDHPEHGTRDIALNYRETCPAGIGPDTYAGWGDPHASQLGGRAVGIPGTVAGLLHALEHYGTLDRETVFAPAIELAQRGWMIDRHHATTAATMRAAFETDPAYAERFPLVARLTGRGLIRRTARIRNEPQARALRRIASLGADEFYRGSMAHAIVGSVRADGGVLTLDDLAGYRVEETTPIRIELGDAFAGEAGRRTMLVMPPPSSGGVAIAQMFGIADRLARDHGFTVPKAGFPDSRNAHLLIETMKHAFADRARHLADPNFVDVPVEEMLDPARLDDAASRIMLDTTIPIDSYGVFRPTRPGDDNAIPEDGGTSHISVVDGRGNAVSCTETINLAFGSKLAVEPYGFCLNNQMDDFTTHRGEPNAFGLTQSDDNLPEPGKRPLSSMSPTIVLDADGTVFAVAGASGGPRIINATAQSLLRVLMADASAVQAVDGPRLHHQWAPDAVYYETALDRRETKPYLGDRAVLLGELGRFGHALRPRADIGACQLIRRVEHPSEHTHPNTRLRWYEGRSDPRKRDYGPVAF